MSRGTLLNLGLPSIPETRNQELFNELSRLYQAVNTLAVAVEAYTGLADVPQDEWSSTPPSSTILTQNMTRCYMKASENIASGLLVNVHKVGSEFQVRIADAGAAKKYHAVGYVSSGNVVAGEFCEVTMGGLSGAYTGLLGNTMYWLGTGGIISPTRPTLTGTLAQGIGFALADNLLYVNPSTQLQVNP